MYKKSNFFKDVASHNLERFHSECIAWVLNRIETIGSKEQKQIFNKFNAGEDFVFKKAIAEVKQHDIVLLYQKADKYKFIFIENKTKSTLSRIKNTKNRNWLKFTLKCKPQEGFNDEFARKIITEGVLQTAYYQLRWLVEDMKPNYRKSLFKAFEINFDESIKIEAEWVILSQMSNKTFDSMYEGEENLLYSKVDSEKKGTLNRLGIENGESGIPDWNYITYRDLFKDFDNKTTKTSFDNQIIKEYINYALELEDNSMDLFAKVKEKLKEKYKDIDIELISGSSNNPTPIIQIILGRVECDSGFTIADLKKMKEEFKSCCNDVELGEKQLRYGVQLEGDNLKFFFAHTLYNYAKPKDKDKKGYVKFVKKTIKELKTENKITEEKTTTKENLPKTRTFYSLSKHLVKEKSERKYWFEKRGDEKTCKSQSDEKFDNRLNSIAKVIVDNIEEIKTLYSQY